MNNENKLTLKDLVMTGVFAALYFVLSMLIGTPLGLLVVTYLAYPFCMSVISGMVTLFYMAKCPKKWLTFIFTLLPGLFMVLFGMVPVILVVYAVCAALAEGVRQKAGVRTIKGMKLAHIFISLTNISGFCMIFAARDVYYQTTANTMGEAYAKTLTGLPLWSLFALAASAIIGAILGAKLGERVLNKHFKKAGLA